MTDEQLKVIEERCARATDGPWGVRREDRCAGYIDYQIYEQGTGGHHAVTSELLHDDDRPSIASLLSGPAQAELDAEFIAAARTDVPALVAEVRQLRDALQDESEAFIAGVKAARAAFAAEWAEATGAVVEADVFTTGTMAAGVRALRKENEQLRAELAVKVR